MQLHTQKEREVCDGELDHEAWFIPKKKKLIIGLGKKIKAYREWRQTVNGENEKLQLLYL